MPATVDQFAKALAASGLMTADDVKAFWNALAADRRPRDGEALAQLLVEAKHLTDFQAAQILAGRGATLLMGDYVVLAEIGAGGMGQVYKARHRRMDRVVALKVMSSAAMKDEAAVKRFQREVRAAAKLEHVNIVTAYDSGEAGKVKYLVMQFVDGGDLSSLVKSRGALPVAKAANYVLQAARGLAFAHAEGVIHRDIKPANLLVDKKGVVKILDMGLARFEHGDDGLTATEQVMGTVDYMSPEQAANTKGVDGRADIYSLGCTLWYLLTGRKVYDGESMIGRLMAHRDAPLPSLVKERDDVPWALEQIFHKMIAKRAQDRYDTMDEVVAALEPFAEGSATGMGSSIGGGSATSPELAAFFQGIGPKSSTKMTTSANVEATTAYPRSEVDTDPKGSATLHARSGVAAKSGERPATPKRKSKQNSSVKLIAGAVVGVCSLLVAALILVLRGSGEAEEAAGPLVPDIPATASLAPAAIEPQASAAATTSPPPVTAGAPTSAAAPLTPPTAAQPVGEPLFNGRDLTGWRSIGGARWTVENGVLVGSYVGVPGWLMTEAEYEHFDVSLEYKLGSEGNSGLFFGAWPEGGDSGKNFHEVQLLDDIAPKFANNPPQNATGSLFGKYAPQPAPRFPTGTWHKLRTRVVGERLEIRIDDVQVVYEILPPGKRARGHLGLQAYGGRAEFRNLRVQALNSDGAPVNPNGSAGSASNSANDFALAFDGQAVVEISNVSWGLLESMTMEAWVRSDETSPGTGFVVDRYKSAALNRYEGRWQFTAKYVGEEVPVYASQRRAHAAGRWDHLAGVIDNGSITLYVNGEKSATTKLQQPLDPTQGGRMSLGKNLRGSLARVRISKGARYTQNFSPLRRWRSDADTLALYQFQEGAGTQLKDESGRGLHGTILGAKWIDARFDSKPANVAPGDYALRFDGRGIVAVPTLYARGGHPFTIECRYRPADISKPLPTNVGLAGWSGVFGLHEMTDHRAGAIGFHRRDKYEMVLDPVVAPRASEFRHLAAVWDGAKVSYYADGAFLESKPMPTMRMLDEEGVVPDHFAVGAFAGVSNGAPAGFAIGMIDEIRVSKTARYAAAYAPLQRFEPDADTLALYHCDEGSGDFLIDSSGNDNHGWLYGAQWALLSASSAGASPVSGFALEFDGRASRVELPLRHDEPTPFTIEATIVPEAATGAIVSNSDGAGIGIDLGQAGVGLLMARRAGGVDDYVRAQGRRPVASGSLRRIAAVFDGRHLRLFSDGKLDATAEFTGTYRPSSLPALIGASPEGTGIDYPFRGRIDEVRFSRTARYDKDYEPAPRLESDADTLALYHCDEGAGDVLRDSSGHGFHGKLIGAKWVVVSTPAAGAGAAGSRQLRDEVGWIDVVPLVDPANDKFSVPKLTGANDWRVENGELRYRSDGLNGKLLLPLVLRGPAMEFEVEFTRLGGSKGFNLDVPAATGPCPVVFDTNKPGRALVGHQGIELPGECRIETGKRTKASLKITRQSGQDHVEVFWNGASLGSWLGDREAIAFSKQEGYSHAARQGLWVPSGQDFMFHKIRARALDGGAIELLRPAANAQSSTTPAAEPSDDAEARERRAAEWVLRIGGAVRQSDHKLIEKLEQLPGGPLRITYVRLSPNAANTPSDAELAQLADLPDLTFLSTRERLLSAAAVGRLGSLPQLRQLSWAGLIVDDAKLAAFAKLTQLTSLYVDGARFQSGQVEALAHALPQLTSLNLRNANLDDTNVDALTGFKQLRVIQLQGTAVTAAGVAQLRKALPACGIEWNGDPTPKFELISRLTIPRDIRSGNWRRDGLTMLTPPQENGIATAVLYLPTPTPVAAEYDVELVVERLDAGGTGMVFGFVSGGRQATVMMDSYGSPPRWGIENIDGNGLRDATNPTYSPGVRLPIGTLKTVRIEVRRDGVRVAVDAEQVVAWKGSPSQLGTHFWKVDRNDSLFLGSQSRFRVHAVHYAPRG